MILYSKTKEDLLKCIQKDAKEIKDLKILYKNKLKVFVKYLKILNQRVHKEDNVEGIVTFVELLHTTEDNLRYFVNQFKKAEKLMTTLGDIKKDADKINLYSFWQKVKEYNKGYNNLKEELVKHSITEENLTLLYIEKDIFNESLVNANESEAEIQLNNENKDEQEAEIQLNNENKDEQEAEIQLDNGNADNYFDIDNQLEENDESIESREENTIEDNDILLISEIQNKVILPYKKAELEKILKSKENDYNDIQTLIEERYTVPLEHYKYARISRFRETFILMREKENASLLDSLDLALELMKNYYVHPAIITACEDSDQLDIYLDCLETNELDDFPFFKVKYELYPLKTKKFKFGSMKEKIKKIDQGNRSEGVTLDKES